MRQFVLKVPTVVLLLAIFLPMMSSELLLGNFLPFLQNETLITVFIYIRYVVIYLWLLSIVDFFSFETNNNTYTRLLQILILISFTLIVIPDYYPWFFNLAAFVIYIVIIVLLFKKIKVLFYERSRWFIILELLILPVGIYTLTEGVKNWKQEEKED